MTRVGPAGLLALGVFAVAQLVAGAAAARGLTVVPLYQPWARTAAPAAAQALARFTMELAQRCPAAQRLPFDKIQPLLPHFGPRFAKQPPPGQQARSRAGDDALGAALRALRSAQDIESDPVALLAEPGRRTRLRELYLSAARGFLLSGELQAAQDALLRVALRLEDQPPASAAHWGPALAALDRQVRQGLPARSQELLIQGPAGWAVHLDERPLGALPMASARVVPGRHAVVVVGLDGTRVSWLLPETAAPVLRLSAERSLSSVCALQDTLALCPQTDTDDLQAAWPALSWFVGSDLLLIRGQRDRTTAWRVHQGQPAGQPVTVRDRDQHALTLLAQQLCTGAEPGSEAGSAAAMAEPVTIAAAGPRRARHRRLLWPGIALLSGGAAVALAGAPLWAYQGQCLDADCAQVYNFHGLAPASLGVGLAATVGGAIWLALELR